MLITRRARYGQGLPYPLREPAQRRRAWRNVAIIADNGTAVTRKIGRKVGPSGNATRAEAAAAV